MKMRKAEDYRNEIKSYIVRAGMTMSELVEILADEYGWSAVSYTHLTARVWGKSDISSRLSLITAYME